MNRPFVHSLRRLRAAFWQRRVLTWLVRIGWLTLLVPTLAMAAYLGLGWQAAWYQWVLPMLLVGLLAGLWAIRPLPLAKLSRRLDDRLALQSRLSTALDLSDPDDNIIAYYLLQESGDIVSRLRRRVRLVGRGLWLEAQTFIAVVAVLGAMLLLDLLTVRLPEPGPVELPPPWQEPSAEDIIPPDLDLAPVQFPEAESPLQAPSPQDARQALQALADAFRDKAATHPVAEAIDRADLEAAGAALRRLADQLPELSEEARAQLADSMQQAADNINPDVPDFTQPLRRGSQSLRNNNLREGAESLEQLAEAVESVQDAPQEVAQEGNEEEGEQSQEPQPQPDQAGEQGGSSGSEMSEGQPPPPEQAPEAERLGVEGQPLELEESEAFEMEERTLQPAELTAPAGEERTPDSPFARPPTHAPMTGLGPDPLTYPWDKRDIIRRYFTP